MKERATKAKIEMTKIVEDRCMWNGERNPEVSKAEGDANITLSISLYHLH